MQHAMTGNVRARVVASMIAGELAQARGNTDWVVAGLLPDGFVLTAYYSYRVHCHWKELQSESTGTRRWFGHRFHEYVEENCPCRRTDDV